jgi:cation transport protein ChaC
MDLPATTHRRATQDLRLTPELVALIARKVEDAGPAPGVVVHNDDDYEASLQGLLAAGAWSGQDVWVFAYGSLSWNPGIEVAGQVPAVLLESATLAAIGRAASDRDASCAFPGLRAPDRQSVCG